MHGALGSLISWEGGGAAFGSFPTRQLSGAALWTALPVPLNLMAAQLSPYEG